MGAGGFLADPTAQMGLSVAKAAMSGGTDYAEKNVGPTLSCGISVLTWL
jgi:protein transport protein YIF1